MTEKLSHQNFDGVVNLLNSPSKPDRTIGFLSLESYRKPSNRIYYMLLVKMCPFPLETWKEEAPKTAAYFNRRHIDSQPTPKFSAIITELKDEDEETVAFVLSRLASILMKSMSSYGDDLSGLVSVELKLKHNGKTKS